jgi:DNA-binding transcriptional regulator YhcF (GntR family)
MQYSITINSKSRIPKYKQIASVVAERIKNKAFPEDKLPSINDLSAWLDISRDTVERAYKELRKDDLVEAVQGKGYYIKNSAESAQMNILLLLNELNDLQRAIYENLAQRLGDRAKITIQVYDNDAAKFSQLVDRNLNQYSRYVVALPGFSHQAYQFKKILKLIPAKQLLLLSDKSGQGQAGAIQVYQDYEEDVYHALTQLLPSLQAYKMVNLVFPQDTYHSRSILKGFQRFCIAHRINARLVSDITEQSVQKGEVYFTLEDDDLVDLVKKVKENDLTVGKDIGILSYQDSPLKELLLGGITVLSSNAKQLGEATADLILKKKNTSVRCTCKVIERCSL